MKQLKFIISGGGTGGHIFPAISIANALKRKHPDAEFLFVGAEGRMEMEKVPNAGYTIKGLPVSGFDRSNLLKNFKVVARLFKSISIAKKIVREFKPDVVVGVGGYASGPTLYAANKLRIPTVLQEQNSYAGVTNKLLAKKAVKICVAYDNMERFVPKDRIILTGNPVRQDFLEVKPKAEEAYRFFGFDPAKKTLLIIGGSLGARTVNQSVINGLEALKESGIQVLWQTGKIYFENAKKAADASSNPNLLATDFVMRMDYAYAVADLVISRAGASSISELCLLGKPSILVPSPNVSEDHQTKNAMALVNKQAAKMITDKDAPEALIAEALKLINDDKELGLLGENAHAMAQLNSADRIAEEILSLIKE
jgi:UDP-N-acetylglucosamine--N-acetylmuramyl-(pentapeptide) pyrophosphoryl-undecaprenol N-acetylglucosamine transferase